MSIDEKAARQAWQSGNPSSVELTWPAFREMIGNYEAAKSPTTQQPDESTRKLLEAWGYASRLFKQLAPQCEPFAAPDVLGVLTQLDNYIAGLHEREAQQPADSRISLFEKALFYLRYSHGCWCEQKPAEGRFHSTGCEVASSAMAGRATERESVKEAHIKLLACAVLGISPDSYTQTEEEYAAEKRLILEVSRHYLAPDQYPLPDEQWRRG